MGQNPLSTAESLSTDFLPFLSKNGLLKLPMNTVVISSEKELDQWRTRIESAWQKSVASVIEVGKLVKQAKEQLGVSYTLLETELPFSSTVAAFLIKIAENPVLSNPTYYSRLPNGYNTLYYLASVDQGQLVRQIESGEITPNFTLASAKSLRGVLTKKTTVKKVEAKKPKTVIYELGSISIAAPKNVDEFQVDLNKLLEKYKGNITHTHKDNSLAEWHRKIIYQQACEMITKSEAGLQNITYEEVRMLEDAAHFLSKDKNQKAKAELVIKDEFVTRTCLPDDYKDLERIRKLIGIEHITRGQLKKWCIENKIPNQFTELSRMDKELYIWEQVRLVSERKDLKGGLKRLKDMASRSTIPRMKTLAQKALKEVTRFENKAS